jgi:glycyl-tRNA synthetase beta chain
MAERDLLLEIGTEEIPARFIPDALEKLRQAIIQELLVKKNIPGADEVSAVIKTYATPRRLAAIVQGLPEVQADRVEEVFGPPVKAAYDRDGNPTRAAIGFASSLGMSPEDLVVKHKGKGQYVAGVMKEKGLPVIEVLPDALRKVILSLHFPKSMRWGGGSLRFVRPIHWITAIFGEEVVSFEIDGIMSGGTSRGHRFLSPGEFRIKGIGQYLRLLERNSVVADQEKRKEMIVRQSEELAAPLSGTPVLEEDLLATVVHLVEYPVAVLGEFSEEYLELPEELLNAVMKGHQKYFSVKDSQGRLKNCFIVVSNTRRENSDVVKAGAERVIRARFEDARFYYRDDRKETLESRVEELGKVTFQERMGSLRDKTSRVEKTAAALAGVLCPGKADKARRAALLSKADLVSGVVREFPELQGTMGMHYAMNDGEDREVCLALMEQYLPAFSGDRLPSTDAGAVLGLADRMDNIAAFFSIGLAPTGSEDPFALRRQALAVIAVLEDRGYEIAIREIVDLALRNLVHIAGSEKAAPGILGFFEQRMEPLLASRGYSFDLIQSVASFSTSAPLKEMAGRLEALKGFKDHPLYNDFLIAFKRVRNILPARELPALRPGLLKDAGELSLREALGPVAREVSGRVKSSDYQGALQELVKLMGPINAFFDEVLVMVKDEAVRDNRLSLLKDIWETASSVADFSKLAEKEAS